MSDSIPVFVNERALAVPLGSSAAEAVSLFDAALAVRLADGSASVTDARGLPVSPGAVLSAGAILRVAASARRVGGVDADG
jgi:hypothetical protein